MIGDDFLFCPKCGSSITDDQTFCGNCGNLISAGKQYCAHCGEEVNANAVVCLKCGCAITPTTYKSENQSVSKKDDSLKLLIKIFMIIGCISIGWTLIPLLWCIPITISVFNSINANEPITTGMKVASLICVSLVAGVIMLCDDNI